jgi:uncharacterized protein (TIGR02453 family)
MTISQATLDFLADLSKNPTKNFMDKNRKRYLTAKEEFSDFVFDMTNDVLEIDSNIQGLEDAKIFRINRDIRFSKDKTPYKKNFGAFVSPGRGSKPGAGYYLHLQPGGESFIGGGAYDIRDKKALFNLRKYFSDRLKKFQKEVLNNKEFTKFYPGISDFEGDLKSAPRGFDKNDPALEYIRHKHFTSSVSVSDKEIISPDFREKVKEKFKSLSILNKFLNDGLNYEPED